MHSIADYFLEVLMGRFLNPDNGAFSEAVNSEIYIDKTRLLEYTNRVIAFCTLWRSQMRFRAVALRSITAARF